MPEHDPVPLPTEDLEHHVLLDEDLVDRFSSQVTETAYGNLDFSLQWKESKEMMELMVESVRKQSLELQEKQKNSDLKQSLKHN
ncbi:hypothetical protein YC2023_076445 [Brassica napus]